MTQKQRTCKSISNIVHFALRHLVHYEKNLLLLTLQGGGRQCAAHNFDAGSNHFMSGYNLFTIECLQLVCIS